MSFFFFFYKPGVGQQRGLKKLFKCPTADWWRIARGGRQAGKEQKSFLICYLCYAPGIHLLLQWINRPPNGAHALPKVDEMLPAHGGVHATSLLAWKLSACVTRVVAWVGTRAVGYAWEPRLGPDRLCSAGLPSSPGFCSPNLVSCCISM